MKRNHGRDGESQIIGEPPAKRLNAIGYGQSGLGNIPRTKHAFKVLVTDGLAAGLLGSHGSTKDEIQKETGARLVFSNRNDYFPETRYRVLGIYTDDPGAILNVFNCIMSQLILHGDEERKAQPAGQTELCGKEPGEYILRFILTRRMQSQIVGTQGNNIRFIRQDSGAKVFVENETVAGHRAGKVIGTPPTIMAALRHINEFVQCESEYEEEFYQGFSRIVNFGEALQRGWEPPPEPKDLDKPSGPRRSAVPAGKGSRASTLKAMPKASQKAGPVMESLLKNIVPPPPPAVLPPANGPANGRAAETEESGHVKEEVDDLATELESFPPGTVKMSYSVCCEVPAARVGALVGTGGEFIRQVQQASGAQIEIEKPSEWRGDWRTMTLVGTLVSIYVAHAMMMSRLRGLDTQERQEEVGLEEEEDGEQEAEQEQDEEAENQEDFHPEQDPHPEAEEIYQEQEDGLPAEESDEEPDVIREQIAKLEEKLARALARRAAAE
ncbi:Pcbp3 [Symbiodinium natans]|uniref:Pcbp3 protein n=1 Tax=Symbiodinium natans TaxID=878477 RepID=A0A812IMJ1_9DINO|nr:Pcbp3 [Symbiodinium natans]